MELEAEVDIVSSDEIDEEARSNMVSIGFSKASIDEWGEESVLEFLKGCADLYERKICDLNMVFYSWLDESAGQIRISAVSQAHNKLPFGCRLNSVNLRQFVNGLYSEDSGLYTKGALDVWRQDI
ncbi:hypothetical protein HXX02_17115 [Microbulbifer elongatus]|uniref:Uncharacterized protein n=2 Tax=Microbulbifer elongatus TaxID=86173 RepID=A0ABT1P4X1_9GAMM|nr:hypothetical protein [Microbulbifer elongatus]MCQ3831156.1 hypothetical protein [Microbulbifer elongatus]